MRTLAVLSTLGVALCAPALTHAQVVYESEPIPPRVELTEPPAELAFCVPSPGMAVTVFHNNKGVSGLKVRSLAWSMLFERYVITIGQVTLVKGTNACSSKRKAFHTWLPLHGDRVSSVPYNIFLVPPEPGTFKGIILQEASHGRK